MNNLGIDLGKHGGLVLLGQDGALLAWARTPLAGKEYDGFAMQSRLDEVLDNCAGQPVRAFVEAPNVMGLFSKQAAAVGTGYGRWVQALEIKGVGYRVITATSWTAMFLPAKRKGMTREDRKGHLVRMARTLHPTAVPWDSLNKDTRSGVADALLIAEYGRRKG